jgi:hypothetical protein
MEAEFQFDLNELKERLEVLKLRIPADEVLNDFVAVEEALKAEVNELVELVGTEDDAGKFGICTDRVPRTKARMLIRSMFAHIEGIVYCMKQVAASVNGPEGPLTLAEEQR